MENLTYEQNKPLSRVNNYLPQHPHVAIFSPLRAPAVLHYPVVQSRGQVVTCSKQDQASNHHTSFAHTVKSTWQDVVVDKISTNKT